MSSSTGIGLGPRSRISAWLHHHRQAATDSFGKLLGAPISTLMTAVAIGIALALPTILLLAIESVERQLSTLDNPPQLTLLLEPSMTIDEASADLSVDMDFEGELTYEDSDSDSCRLLGLVQRRSRICWREQSAAEPWRFKLQSLQCLAWLLGGEATS